MVDKEATLLYNIDCAYVVKAAGYHSYVSKGYSVTGFIVVSADEVK